MNKVIFLVVSLCFVQLIAARSVRDAPAESENALQTTITEIQTRAHDALSTFRALFLDVTGFKNEDEFFNSVKEQAKTFASKYETIQATLTEEAKKNSATYDEVVKNVNTNLQAAVKTLEEKNPEAFADFSAYRENVQTNLNTLVGEADKLGDVIKKHSETVSADLKNSWEELYKNTVDLIQKTTKALEEKKN
uniref:Putative apolipophorin-iii n=1 Tax=Corethrella appendiculata TaxID=1370023 RepID=U5ETF8_9DIPT